MTTSGAFVISLDFELQWGVRERMSGGGYGRALLGARRAIPRMLDLFVEFGIAATWATVGFLFARSRQELRECSPAMRPRYADPRLDPYEEAIGEGEADDPLHFAPSLIQAIRGTPRQEIATHTFSHYYCREPGQDLETFRADLAAACALASRWGVTLDSIVFPRNQHQPAYDAALLEHGIVAYRGNPRSWMWRFAGARDSASIDRRAARAVDAYAGASGLDVVRWDEVLEPSGLCNVRASRFLAPYRPALGALEPLRSRRIAQGLRAAAQRQQLYHLWWHPHNFGTHIEESLRVLRGILVAFDHCRSLWGMRSLSMAEVSEVARSRMPDAVARQWHIPA